MRRRYRWIEDHVRAPDIVMFAGKKTRAEQAGSTGSELMVLRMDIRSKW